MKLTPAVLAAKGPAGVWLMDETGVAQITISVQASGNAPIPRLVLDKIAALIGEAIPEDGIEV